jgi:hypothetical protein
MKTKPLLAVQNAVKYTRSGEDIHASTSASERQTSLSASDLIRLTVSGSNRSKLRPPSISTLLQGVKPDANSLGSLIDQMSTSAQNMKVIDDFKRSRRDMGDWETPASLSNSSENMGSSSGSGYLVKPSGRLSLSAQKPKSLEQSIPLRKRKPLEPSVGAYMLGRTVGSGSFGKVRMGTHIITNENVRMLFFSVRLGHSRFLLSRWPSNVY